MLYLKLFINYKTFIFVKDKDSIGILALVYYRMKISAQKSSINFTIVHNILSNEDVSKVEKLS